jgi:hypothetical protein
MPAVPAAAPMFPLVRLIRRYVHRTPFIDVAPAIQFAIDIFDRSFDRFF